MKAKLDIYSTVKKHENKVTLSPDMDPKRVRLHLMAQGYYARIGSSSLGLGKVIYTDAPFSKLTGFGQPSRY